MKDDSHVMTNAGCIEAMHAVLFNCIEIFYCFKFPGMLYGEIFILRNIVY